MLTPVLEYNDFLFAQEPTVFNEDPISDEKYRQWRAENPLSSYHIDLVESITTLPMQRRKDLLSCMTDIIGWPVRLRSIEGITNNIVFGPNWDEDDKVAIVTLRDHFDLSWACIANKFFPGRLIEECEAQYLAIKGRKRDQSDNEIDEQEDQMKYLSNLTAYEFFEELGVTKWVSPRNMRICNAHWFENYRTSIIESLEIEDRALSLEDKIALRDALQVAGWPSKFTSYATYAYGINHGAGAPYSEQDLAAIVCIGNVCSPSALPSFFPGRSGVRLRERYRRALKAFEDSDKLNHGPTVAPEGTNLPFGRDNLGSGNDSITFEHGYFNPRLDNLIYEGNDLASGGDSSFSGYFNVGDDSPFFRVDNLNSGRGNLDFRRDNFTSRRDGQTPTGDSTVTASPEVTPTPQPKTKAKAKATNETGDSAANLPIEASGKHPRTNGSSGPHNALANETKKRKQRPTVSDHTDSKGKNDNSTTTTKPMERMKNERARTLWSQEELTKLMDMRKQNKSHRQIATALGRSVSAVKTKYERMSKDKTKLGKEPTTIELSFVQNGSGAGEQEQAPKQGATLEVGFPGGDIVGPVEAAGNEMGGGT